MANETVERRIMGLMRLLLEDEPVVAVHGPRSVGKSTLLRRIADEAGVDVIDLDDPDRLDAVRGNLSYVVQGTLPLCIDEYQHEPRLLDALKARLNREGTAPGVAVLTGSTRQDALPHTAQALTGRVHNLVLWPLSQGEIDQTEENILERLADSPEDTVNALPQSETSRDQYVRRIVRGGFPIPLTRPTDAARNRWFDSYVRTSLERDARALSRIRARQALADVLAQLAGRTAQVLNVSEIASSLELSRDQLETHIRLLEDLFLVSRLPAWGKTLTARSTARPKSHIVDSGLAARLMRVNTLKLATLDPTVQTDLGHLVETFVVGELRKQVSWLEDPATIGHWRSNDRDEVDLVVELFDGRVLAFEVKSAERVSGRDLRGLRTLRDRVGERFVAGIALSMGSRSYLYEDRLAVMPIDRLWRTVP